MSIRMRRLTFGAALVVVLILSLWPTPEPLPLNTGWDKTDHVAAFAALGLLGLPAWPQLRARVLLGLVAYGGLIELLQGLTVYRQADWGDLLADAAGGALAAMLYAGWLRWRGGAS